MHSKPLNSEYPLLTGNVCHYVKDTVPLLTSPNTNKPELAAGRRPLKCNPVREIRSCTRSKRVWDLPEQAWGNEIAEVKDTT